MKLVGIFVFVLCMNGGICRYSNKTTYRFKASPKVTPSQTFAYYTESQKDITIPIIIHLDKALTRNLTREYKKTVKKYFRDVLNKVEKLYAHPSLNQTIHFDLLDVKMLRNATKKFQMSENVSHYLKSYCLWQGEKKIEKKRWYYSVLFTGLNIYSHDARRNKVYRSTGLSYMRGICSNGNSCTLLEWDFRNIAYLMAHEIAHSLGISHDGPPYNQCRGQRYIMAEKYNTRNPATTWSACNKLALKKFLLIASQVDMRKCPNTMDFITATA